MALLPNNCVYRYPISTILSFIDGLFESQVVRAYGIYDRSSTAMEDLWWWVGYANGRGCSIDEYALTTPYHEDVNSNLRTTHLEQLDELISRWIDMTIPELDSIFNPDIVFSIERHFLICLDVRRQVYVPTELFTASTERLAVLSNTSSPDDEFYPDDSSYSL